MRISLPILFNQMDSRWASTLLGFNTQAQYNFYNFACLISTLAEVACYYGYDETPLTINQKLKNLGVGVGYVAGGGNYIWGAFTKLFPKIKERKIETPSKLTDAQIGEIKSALDAGFPVMVQIDVNPKTVANDTHYSALVDYNNGDENDFTLADTLGGKLVSLKTYLGWYRPSARESIYKYIIFEGVLPQQQAGTIPVDKKTFERVVRNSGEWDKTSGEYLPDQDPNSTDFPAVQRVVNGYKSRVTDLQKQVDEAGKAKAVAEQEVVNQKDKLANVTAACQRELELKNTEISVLKSGSTAIEKLRGQYEGTIGALEEKLREAQKTIGLRDTRIVELESQKEPVKEFGIADILNAITALLKKLGGK